VPYVRAWAARYKEQGLVVIGVHTPEFTFEEDVDNVRRAAQERGVTYHKAFKFIDLKLAEREGFEPSVEFPLHTLSKRAPSTTRTSLRVFGI
jgi:hypothetical protein